jgi:hypothetical protein
MGLEDGSGCARNSSHTVEEFQVSQRMFDLSFIHSFIHSFSRSSTPTVHFYQSNKFTNNTVIISYRSFFHCNNIFLTIVKNIYKEFFQRIFFSFGDWNQVNPPEANESNFIVKTFEYVRYLTFALSKTRRIRLFTLIIIRNVIDITNLRHHFLPQVDCPEIQELKGCGECMFDRGREGLDRESLNAFLFLTTFFPYKKMVCEKCKKKLKGVICPDPWKAGRRATSGEVDKFGVKVSFWSHDQSSHDQSSLLLEPISPPNQAIHSTTEKKFNYRFIL